MRGESLTARIGQVWSTARGNRVSVMNWSLDRIVAGGLTFVLLTTQAAPAIHAETIPTATPPVLGCSWAPSGLNVEVVAEAEEDEDGNTADTVEKEPKIVGSLPAPANVRPKDQRRLAAVATITREQAVQIALGALPDAERREIEEVELEVEQGYVVWGVEAVLRGRQKSPDRHAEVVIDAGNGKILMVECEAEDD